jgi:hypothetical protein
MINQIKEHDLSDMAVQEVPLQPNETVQVPEPERHGGHPRCILQGGAGSPTTTDVYWYTSLVCQQPLAVL